MQCPTSLHLLSEIFQVDKFCMWPYNYLFLMCCVQLPFSAILSIRIYVSSKAYSTFFVSVHVLQPYRKIDSSKSAVNSLILVLGSDDVHTFCKLWHADQAGAFRLMSLMELLT